MIISLEENEFIREKVNEFPGLLDLIEMWNNEFSSKSESDDLNKLKKIFMNIFNTCYRSLNIKFKYLNYDIEDGKHTSPTIISAIENINFLFKMYKQYDRSINSPVEEIRDIMKNSSKKRRKHNR